MVWAKSKKFVIVGGIVLAAIVASSVISDWGLRKRQRLDDGSVLTLDRVIVGTNVQLTHGKMLEKLLGDVIPSKGMSIGPIKLVRPSKRGYTSPSNPLLVAEISIVGPNAAHHLFGSYSFQAIIYGQRGFEYPAYLQLDYLPDGYAGYIAEGRYPRDSSWLGFRIQQRDDRSKDASWKTIADVRGKNPARTVIQPWMTNSLPIVKSAEGYDLTINGVTTYTNNTAPNQNHGIFIPLEVRSRGLLLTNWSGCRVRAEDASGNWTAFNNCPDPYYVWKVDVDFEPHCDDGVNVSLPAPPSTFTTNIMEVPVTISWDGRGIRASMPTNRPEIAIQFVKAWDEDGNQAQSRSSLNWKKFEFKAQARGPGGFYYLKDGHQIDTTPTKLAIAIVPSVHVTFFAKPRIEDERDEIYNRH